MYDAPPNSVRLDGEGSAERGDETAAGSQAATGGGLGGTKNTINNNAQNGKYFL